MRKYIYITIAIIIGCLLTWIGIECYRASNYKSLYEKELQNVEAYRVTNSGLEGEVIEYRMTIDELYASKDSLDRKLAASVQQLNVATNKIKNLQYQLKEASRVDTIKMVDTIFIEGVNIDTTLGDEWYNLRLQLQYPATVITEPTFSSEQFVYIYNKKEYVGGKSKCFFINWFKKKYMVTEVKIEEKNPYIKTINQKFIEVN